MHISLGQDVDKEWFRETWQQQLTIENADYLIDHFLDLQLDYMLQNSSPTPWPERECFYWEDCYVPVFNGDYGLEIGTPLGAYEFNTGGNSINFSPDSGGCPTGVGPCIFYGPESQINTATGETSTGVNAALGVGAGGAVGGVGVNIWAGREYSTVSNQPLELTVSYSNLIHAEFAGFSLEFNYTPQ